VSVLHIDVSIPDRNHHGDARDTPIDSNALSREDPLNTYPNLAIEGCIIEYKDKQNAKPSYKVRKDYSQRISSRELVRVFQRFYMYARLMNSYGFYPERMFHRGSCSSNKSVRRELSRSRFDWKRRFTNRCEKTLACLHPSYPFAQRRSRTQFANKITRRCSRLIRKNST